MLSFSIAFYTLHYKYCCLYPLLYQSDKGWKFGLGKIKDDNVAGRCDDIGAKILLDETGTE